MAGTQLFAKENKSLDIPQCFDQPYDYFNSGYEVDGLYLCSPKKPLRKYNQYCTQKVANKRCQLFSAKYSDTAFDVLVSNKNKGKINKVLRRNKRRKEILDTYLHLMDWKSPLVYSSALNIHTGGYPKFKLGSKSLNSKCFLEILQSAYLLNSHFKTFNFSIDEKITNCGNLISGVNSITRKHKKVRKNVLRFHTPMHSIFLTNKTKYNHYLIGQMGLHINVNRKDEIEKRLIDFKIYNRHIPHERGIKYDANEFLRKNAMVDVTN